MSKKIHKRMILGSVLNEAVIIFPIILGVTFSVIEFGRIFYYVNSLNHIARSSASYVSTGPKYTVDNLKTLTNSSSILPNINELMIEIYPETNATRTLGDSIIVTASVPFSPLFPDFIKLFTAGGQSMWPSTLVARATNRVEVPSGGPTLSPSPSSTSTPVPTSTPTPTPTLTPSLSPTPFPTSTPTPTQSLSPTPFPTSTPTPTCISGCQNASSATQCCSGAFGEEGLCIDSNGGNLGDPCGTGCTCKSGMCNPQTGCY